MVRISSLILCLSEWDSQLSSFKQYRENNKQENTAILYASHLIHKTFFNIKNVHN